MPATVGRPLVVGARREALVVAVVWAAVLSFNAWYGYTHGTGRTLENITFVLGFPDWIFWGFIVPWFACLAFQIAFAYGFMKDDPLGDEETDAADETLLKQGEVSHD